MPKRKKDEEERTNLKTFADSPHSEDPDQCARKENEAMEILRRLHRNDIRMDLLGVTDVKLLHL